jgi:hypothetical protein
LFSVGWSGFLHRRGDGVLNFLQELEVCFQSDDRVFCFADRGDDKLFLKRHFLRFFFFENSRFFLHRMMIRFCRSLRECVMCCWELCVRERERVIVCLGVRDSRVFFLCI